MNIGWKCRAPGCGVQGFDLPGLRSFYMHWLAWHAPRSIFDRTGL